VPGEVYFTLDIRDIYEENRDRMEAELRASVLKAAQPANLEYSIQETARHQPVLLPSGMVELVSEAARQAGVPAHRLPSGAGHDAQVMASAVDAGMIFVRSQAGISHSPREFSSAADICLGVEVLYQAVRLLDGQEARRMSGG
jgi:acetylornithine deacetylase/succinyl-diaminopimelate desuccinylase-like protein